MATYTTVTVALHTAYPDLADDAQEAREQQAEHEADYPGYERFVLAVAPFGNAMGSHRGADILDMRTLEFAANAGTKAVTLTHMSVLTGHRLRVIEIPGSITLSAGDSWVRPAIRSQPPWCTVCTIRTTLIDGMCRGCIRAEAREEMLGQIHMLHDSHFVDMARFSAEARRLEGVEDDDS